MSDIICPYCGHAHEDGPIHVYELGAANEKDCVNCGKDFIFFVEYNPKYTSYCAPDNHVFRLLSTLSDGKKAYICETCGRLTTRLE